MPIHDEDNDPPDLFRRSRNQSRDEDADEHEMTAPDDFSTVPCTRCRKLIFEDTERCPYCKHYQLEEERNRKPLWFTLTAIILFICFSGVLALLLIGKLLWHR